MTGGEGLFNWSRSVKNVNVTHQSSDIRFVFYEDFTDIYQPEGGLKNTLVWGRLESGKEGLKKES